MGPEHCEFYKKIRKINKTNIKFGAAVNNLDLLLDGHISPVRNFDETVDLGGHNERAVVFVVNTDEFLK